jgi:universal stress protein E
MEIKNNPVRRIVVGTDFSRPARAAIIRASMLAAEHAAKLEIIHVTTHFSAPPGIAILRSLGKGPDPLVQQALDEAVELARSYGASVTAKVLTGRSATTLAEEAKNLGADLVVVGARGQRSLRDAVIGTTAERLMERSGRDILIVRSTPKAAYAKILVALALDSLSPSVINCAAHLSDHAQLHVLHVYQPPLEDKLMNHGAALTVVAEHRRASKEDAAQNVEKTLLQCTLPENVALETILKRGYPPEEILRAASRFGADLVIVGKNQSASHEFFLGSTTKHVVRGSSSDVLVSALDGAAS